MIDKLVKISSLASAFLIFCGFLKLIIYYSAFGIDIVEFLSFTEIITSFLDDVNLILVFGLAMIIQSVPLMNYIQRKTNLSIDVVINAILLYAYAKRKYYIGFFVLAAVISIGLIVSGMLTPNYSIIYLLIICIIQTVTFLVMFPEEGKIEISNSGLAATTITTITLTIFLLAWHDIDLAKRHSKIVELHTGSGEIVCSSETGNIYLGKTDSFVFIQTTDGKSIGLPISSVTKFAFISQ